MQKHTTVQEASDAQVKEVVRHRYSALARSGVSNKDPAARQVAEPFGYSEDEFLKPGGRLAVTDLALKQALPPELAADLSAYVGCVAGAMLIGDYEVSLTAAGFDAVHIIDSGQDLNTYARLDEPSGCCDPSGSCGSSPAEAGVHQGLAELLRKFDINEYVASVHVLALKPK